MNRGISPFGVHRPDPFLMMNVHHLTCELHRFLVAERQSIQTQADNNPMLDANADDCKTASSLVIASAPLLVSHIHVSILLRI